MKTLNKGPCGLLVWQVSMLLMSSRADNPTELRSQRNSPQCEFSLAH